MDDFESICIRAFSEKDEGRGRIGVIADEMFVDHLNKRRWRRVNARGDGLVDGFEEAIEKSGWKFGFLTFVTYLKLKILKALRCLWHCPCVQMTLP